MKRLRLLLATVSMLAFPALTAAQTCDIEPYRDASLPAGARAADLLSRLTLGEKVGLMTNESQPVERLGIKPYNWWNEALHGVARAGRATVFPQPAGIAASFDTSLCRRIFTAVSDEARAKHKEAASHGERGIYQGLTFWTPNINIFRDPRWGRGQETYGEDPFLTSRMAVAVITGLQGDTSARYDKLHACAKHYAVHSGPEWNRHEFNATGISKRDLYETYLPAFEASVREAGVKEVMCAYNRFDGEPCCSNSFLLKDILRDAWGFEGVVVSDCGAVSDFYASWGHKYSPDRKTAAAAALRGGTDITCLSEFSSLYDAVKEGAVKESELDAHVLRLLEARFSLGEMDPDSLVCWSGIPFETVCSPQHHALALRSALESVVLLQNRKKILPLDSGEAVSSHIAVCGANACDSVMQWGNYNGFPTSTSTLLQAVRSRLGQDVLYVRGCPLAAAGDIDFTEQIDSLKDIETVIYAGGLSPRLEGEQMDVEYDGFRGGDRTSIELPPVQRKFLQALKKAGKKVIFVNYSGSAVALEPETSSCDAIVQAWYPGEAGGEAVAMVLFGEYNPSGALPVTFYRDDSQLPDYEDYSMKGRTYRYFGGRPLFRFGFGLSYTVFTAGEPRLLRTAGRAAIPYSRPRALLADSVASPVWTDVELSYNDDGRPDRAAIPCGSDLHLVVPVANTGSRDGECILQVYLRREDDDGGPRLSLRGFSRVPVRAGESSAALVTLRPEDFSAFDTDAGRMDVQPGSFIIYYGFSSDLAALHSFRLKLEKTERQ